VTRGRVLVLLWLAALPVLACQTSRGAAFPGEPLRLSQVANAGDAARRASMRVVMTGLDADARGRSAEASSLYERALQVDPTNPYAWLALARQEVFEGDPERGLASLDKAQALLTGDESAAAHLAGIRAAGLAALGQSSRAAPYANEARARAPGVWSDGKLDASELR